MWWKNTGICVRPTEVLMRLVVNGRLMAAPSGGNSASGVAFHRLPWVDIDAFAHLMVTSPWSSLPEAGAADGSFLLYALLQDAAKIPGMSAVAVYRSSLGTARRVEEAFTDRVRSAARPSYTRSLGRLTTRLLRNGLAGVGPLWIHVGHVHAIAAAPRSPPFDSRSVCRCGTAMSPCVTRIGSTAGVGAVSVAEVGGSGGTTSSPTPTVGCGYRAGLTRMRPVGGALRPHRPTAGRHRFAVRSTTSIRTGTVRGPSQNG